MALFQEQEITQEEFDKKHNINQPDFATRLGFDDIQKERQQIRQKNIEQEQQWVNNIVSPDKIKEWKKQGAMTPIDVWHKKDKNELMPFMGTWKQGTKSFEIKRISDKLNNGEIITPEERKKFENFVLDLAEVQTRGYSFLGGATNLGLETIPFMAEFGLGLLTSGGTASVGATTSKLSTEVLKKGLTKQIAEGVGKTVYNATINPRTYAFTATRLPQQVRARMGDIMLSDSLAISPEGQAILKESNEKPAIAFMKALALINIETASELSGAMLVRPIMQTGGKLGKVLASPIMKALPDGFADKFIKLAEQTTKLPFFKAVDDLGWNGILEEMGEERVGDLLQYAFNLDNKEGYSFEQLLDAMFPNISEGFGEFTKSLGQEALSFGATGVGMNALHHGIKSIPKVGDKYTKDGFLIDAGIFRVAGYDSYLDGKVREELAKNGKSEEEIDNAINFSTRDDKVQFLKETKTDFDTKKEYDAKEFEKDLKRMEIEDKAYEKLLHGGVSQKVAFANSKLFGQFFKRYGANNTKAFDEWFNKFDVQYDVPAEEQNKTQFQSVADAGANENEIADAKKEWKKKGTDSKYFKKWFGNSKVVDKDGKPLVVYHGAKNAMFSEFNSELSNYDEISKGFNFFTNKEKSYPNSAQDYAERNGGKEGFVFDVYLKMENPLHIKYSGHQYYTPIDCYDSNYKEIKEQYNKGNYDGVIIENTDKDIDDSVLYAVKNSEQIKSVGNRGTFDESNPNIYYQKDNTVDWTDKFDKVPTFEEIEKHIKDIIASGEVFDTLSPEWKIDIKGGNRVVDKITNQGNFQNLNNPQKKRHNKYVAGIKELINNSVYSHPADNDKPKEKPNVLKYHYFDVNIRIGEKTYWVRLECEENKKSSSGIYANRSKTPFEDNNNVKQNKNDVKVVHLYNIKEMKANKTLFQDANDEEEKLIAGFTYQEVLDKLTELNEELYKNESKLSQEEKEKIVAQMHTLEDVFDASENPHKYPNEKQRQDLFVNTYYIMNNQEIPDEYIETEKKSARTYKDLLDIHNKKKADKEAQYYGYFTEGLNKNIITIMPNSNASTALHELGHLFLNGLNELAKVDENARKQLEAVNKWLGFSGEYTVKQQEKFARSFEAYLYKGKAPNNTLRQVFENFKEWLKSVYESITELENKGADISDEVQEMFDNMFGGDEYYQEQKQANELLRKVKDIAKKDRVENIAVRKDKELDETAKRHKNIAYEILSVGTGKSIKYLKTIFETDSTKKSFGKKREAVQELLEYVDDKINVTGGMRAHWKEFFADTGVSYDTEEVKGDYELVKQALDVIINKKYGDVVDANDILDNRAAYFEKAIDEADRQYKILLKEFKSGNRNVALSAIYEWIENLEEEIRQDYEDRFIYDSGIIERNENVDKFEKAKRQIISKALELENQYSINDNEKYQETVKEIMRSLDFLQPSDKAKLTVNILDLPSVSFLMDSIDDVLDIAKTMEDINLRRNLEREIHKELQGTKNIRKNGRTVGKYNYKTNKIFEELRELDRLTPEQANELRLEIRKFADAEDNGLSYKDKLVNKFLSYKAGGRTFADTELMKSLYDEIVKIKLIGKSAKSELDLQEKLSETKDIEELINIVQNKKDSKFLIKGYISTLGNLESTLNAIFNKDIKDRYGAEILYAETQAQAWQHEQKQKFEHEVAKIYNLPEWCWDKKILEYLGEKHTYPELRRKYDEKGEILKTRTIDRTLTKMDIILAYIWSKNAVLNKCLLNQFGEDTLYAMFDEMSTDDVKLAELMMRTAQSFYPLVNKTFINKYGLDLPKVSCYFPSTPERGSEVDLYNEYSSKSLNNSFTKSRANSETQPMDFHNPVAILYSHIEGVGKFAFMSDALDRANLRFKDNDLKRVIINKYGEDAYRTLEQILMNVTYKKEAPVFNGMNKIIDNMVGNWIQANVAVKPIVGLKQLLSANNYAVDMPYMTWQKGFLKALAHPKETIDYMMNIPYIKARYQGSYANEFLKQTVENSAFATSKKLKDLCNMFIKMGDIGAIMFGGKPYVEYLINEKGMTEAQAIKQFILSTNRSQQSSAVSSLSNFQVAMTRNPMGKLFIAFKNSPQQYIRMCGDAIVSVANGDMTKTQCAKMLFQFGYLQPFFYAVATSGAFLRFIFTGDDDDLMKDASISVFNFGSDALPILGDIYKYALNKIAYKEKYLPQTTPLLGDIQQEIDKISKKDVELGDYLEAIGYLGLHVGLGYNSKAFTTIGSGVGDIATGNIEQGAMKVLGYTNKRSKHITGNEDKK